MQEYQNAHPATVAWSAYNWLATQDGPRSIEDVLAGLQFTWDAQLTPAALAQAVTEAISRGLLESEAGLLDVKDPKRRILISRTRGADPWAGWRIGERRFQVTTPIEHVLKGSK